MTVPNAVYFFAYGIELNRSRFQTICPGAKTHYSAVLPNYRIRFSGWNRLWRSSTVTLQASQGDQVKGGLYIVRDQDLLRIERATGGGKRLNIRVFPDTGSAIDAVTFVHQEQSPDTAPSPEYLAVVKQGYRDWGLD